MRMRTTADDGGLSGSQGRSGPGCGRGREQGFPLSVERRAGETALVGRADCEGEAGRQKTALRSDAKRPWSTIRASHRFVQGRGHLCLHARADQSSSIRQSRRPET
ncbi:hypothetical protein RRF57_008651 [Xylaria bambusicola]|uniref:Uncharacterized protein n=1 Tax=Xylaria bambusicola TaxID=326684 RepID=A0AAN7UPR5_9PEZI